jgi:hypothetical protein
VDLADSNYVRPGPAEIYSGTTQMRPLANASGVRAAERLRMIAAEIERRANRPTSGALGHLSFIRSTCRRASAMLKADRPCLPLNFRRGNALRRKAQP